MVPLLVCLLLLQVSTSDPPGARVTLPDESQQKHGPGDGSGEVIVRPKSVVAGAPCSLAFTYTASASIQEGGGIACLVSAFWGWTGPQVTRADGPGYVDVHCDADGVQFEVEVHEPSRAVYFRVTKGVLPRGAEVRFTYTGRADSYAEREERFFFRVDGDGDGFYVALDQQPTFEVLPRLATQLVCYGPGHAYVDQPLEISVAALDAGGNRARAFRGTIKLSVEGVACDQPDTIAFSGLHAGAQRVSLTPREAGVLLVRAEDAAAGLTLGQSQPILVRKPGEKLRLYWGDLHGHTNRSDGTGTPEDYLHYARDVARMDVIALTDHDHWGYRPLQQDAPVWQQLLRATAKANEPGRFLTLPGYEWTNWTWGHMHVLFERESEAEIFAWNQPGSTSPKELWERLGSRSVLTIPHHTGGSTMPFHWQIDLDPRFVPVVEICSVHGVSESLENRARVPNPVRSGMVQTALAGGHRLGLIGSGDSHDGHPGLRRPGGGGGLVGIYARDLTRSAIFEALRKRRVYATTGCRAVLRFHISGHPMGSEVTWSDPQAPRSVRVDVFGDDLIRRISLVRGNETIAEYAPNEPFAQWTFEDDTNLDTGTFYYVRIEQADGHQIFSSPIWLSP